MSLKAWQISLGTMLLLSCSDQVLAANIQTGNDFSLASTGTINDNLIATGTAHDIKGTIIGDAFLAGREIYLHGQVQGDTFALGSKVSLFQSSTVHGNAYIAGNQVYLEGNLAHDLSLYTHTAKILSSIAGNARIKGQNIELDNVVLGSVKVTAPYIKLGSNTRISGDFKFSSSQEPIIETGAKIDGQIIRLPSESTNSLYHAGYWLYILICCLSSWLLGLLLSHFFPHNVATVTASIQNWSRNLLIGLLFIIGSAVTIPFLALTLIGLPLAIGLGFLFVFLLYFGHIPAAFFLSTQALQRLAPTSSSPLLKSFSLLISLFIISLIGIIPVLGGIAQILVTLIGIGAIIKGKSMWYAQLKEKDLN